MSLLLHTHARNGKVKKSLLFHRCWKCTLKHMLSALQTVWIFLMHIFLSLWAALIIKAAFTHTPPQMLSSCGSVLSGLDRIRWLMSLLSRYSGSSWFWHIHMDPSYSSVATALGQSLHTLLYASLRGSASGPPLFYVLKLCCCGL